MQCTVQLHQLIVHCFLFIKVTENKNNVRLLKLFFILDENNGTAQGENKPLEIDFESAPNISVGFRLASYKQGIVYCHV